MCEKYTKFGALSLEKVFEYVTILLRNKNRKLGYEKKLRLRGRISIFLSKKGN